MYCLSTATAAMMMPLAAGVLGIDQIAASDTTDRLQSTGHCHDSSNSSNTQQHHSGSVECGYKPVSRTAATAAVTDVELTDVQHRSSRQRHAMQDSNSSSNEHDGMRKRGRSHSPLRTAAVTGVAVSDVTVASPHSSLLPLYTARSHCSAVTGTDTTVITSASSCSSTNTADDVSGHVAKPGDNLRKAVALGIAYSATLGNYTVFITYLLTCIY
jgi:hypothetical protein